MPEFINIFNIGYPMLLSGLESQPAPHKHGEVQKRGKVLEQIINSCELLDKHMNALPGFIYTYVQYWLSHAIVRVGISACSPQTWGGPKERLF